MNHNKVIPCVSSLVLLCGLVACNGGGSPTYWPGHQSPVTLLGHVAHGVSADAIVRAVRADTGEELAATRTGADGSYELTLNYHGPLLLTAETDENTLLLCDSLLPEGCGAFPSATTGDLNQNGVIDVGETFQPGPDYFQLRSFLPNPRPGRNESIDITPLTHATWALVQQSGHLSEAGFKRAQSQVNRLFGMEGDRSHGTIPSRSSALTADDRNSIAHHAIAKALNSWAYLQPDGYRQALERFAEAIANNQLPGQASDRHQLSLSGIMDLAETALQRAAHEHPGWPISDLIARFGILRHIGVSHGDHPVPLPDPDYPGSSQERLAKGKRLVSDLRSWAYGLMAEMNADNDKYSGRLADLEELANILEKQHPLLEDAYRLFGLPSNRVFERIWSDIYPCLAAGAVALQANKVILQPELCPTLNLTGDGVELQGQLLNRNGLIISDLDSFRVERINADNGAEGEFNFSGRLTDLNAGITLTIASARWRYRLKADQPQLADDWDRAQDQFQTTSLESHIVLADQQPPERQTLYQGSWHLSLDSATDVPASARLQAEGILRSPHGSLGGTFRTEVQKHPRDSHHKNDIRSGSLIFQGFLRSHAGDLMTGTIRLDSHDEDDFDGIRPLHFGFEGKLESPTGSAFEGNLKLVSDAPHYQEPATPSEWLGWWHAEQLGKSVASGLKLLDFVGKVSTATDEYLLLRAYLDIHNPGSLVSRKPLRQWNLGTWGEMLDGTPEDFARFSATLLFEEGIPGRENSWVSLSLDRTGYREASAELRLSSNLASDWRSMILRYDYLGAEENPSQLFSFINQNGAQLKLDIACEDFSDGPWRNCKNSLKKNLRGILLVDGEQVGQLQMLDNRLLKMTYSNGQFETIQ